MHRIVACPGYWSLRKECPPRAATPASTFGNAVHDAMANEDMVLKEQFSWTINQCQLIKAQVVREMFGDNPDYFSAIETRFWTLDKDGNRLFSAQADFLAGRDGRWLVLDWKGLPGDVDDAAWNWQLLTIAVCVAMDDERRNRMPLDELYAAIIQPSVTKHPTLVRYDLNQIVAARRMIIEKINAANQPHAPRIPGNHCKYCECAAYCVEAQSMGMILAAPQRAVAQLSPEQLIQVYERLPVINDVIAEIRKRMKLLAETDPDFAYQLIDRKGNLKITNLKAAREALEPHVTAKEFNSMLDVAVTQLRELFVDRYAATEHTTKVIAGKKFMELIANASERQAPVKMLAKKEIK